MSLPPPTTEDGFTIVEVMVTIMVLSLGILAYMQTLVPLEHSTSSSERTAVQGSIAEQELEKIESYGYSCTVLSGTPTTSTEPNNPGFYVQAGSPPTFQWDLTNTSRREPLVTSTGLPSGCTQTLSAWQANFAPTTSWSSGGQSGTIYRYITWVDDPCDPTVSPPKCATTTDYKRVTLMITRSGGGGPFKPVLLSTIVADPTVLGPG